MRAKAENSLIRRPIVSTWRMMVATTSGTAARSSPRLASILARQPLGREADRGERVLDLVRDAPRHLGPGGLALGVESSRDVVEGQDVAARPLALALRGRRTRRMRSVPPRSTRELPPRPARPGARAGRSNRACHEPGRTSSIGRPAISPRWPASAARRRGSRTADRFGSTMRRSSVEADHARPHARQHRLGEAAPLVELLVGLDQLAALARRAGRSSG